MFALGLAMVLPGRRAWKAEQARMMEELRARQAARPRVEAHVGEPGRPVISKCPACGAPLDPGAPQCGFCNAVFR
jgi:hypothetical protein